MITSDEKEDRREVCLRMLTMILKEYIDAVAAEAPCTVAEAAEAVGQISDEMIVKFGRGA